MLNNEKKLSLLLDLSLGTFAAVLAVLTLRYILWWLLPFLLSLGIAAVFEPIIVYLQRHAHFRRGFSAALLTLFLLFLLGGILSFLVSTLLSEARSVLSELPKLFEALSERSFFKQSEAWSARLPPVLRQYAVEALSSWETQGADALRAAAAALLEALAGLAGKIPQGMLAAATAVLAVFFTCSAYPALREMLKNALRETRCQRLGILRSGLKAALLRYLRAQTTLCFLTFVQLFLAFSLLSLDYSLLAAFLITLVDALPVFGAGTILLPWALLELLLGSVPRAAALFALYLCTLLVRNIAEPHLMTASVGIPPIFSLLAMYIGFCSLGVTGMILFPFLLLLAVQTIRTEHA